MPNRSTSTRVRAAGTSALVLLALASPGCGVLALVHDKLLGPISPAGRIHPLTVGDDFRISDKGPVATIVDPNPFRMFPPNPLKRLYRTPRTIMQGLQFYLGFVGRYVLQRHDQKGRRLAPEKLAELQALRHQDGRVVTAGDVLRILGVPRQWFKRKDSGLMVYGADARDELAFSLGLPPGVGNLLPIPGIGELLRFDYNKVIVEHSRTLVFFDAQERVVGVVQQRPVHKELDGDGEAR